MEAVVAIFLITVANAKMVVRVSLHLHACTCKAIYTKSAKLSYVLKKCSRNNGIIANLDFYQITLTRPRLLKAANIHKS